MKKETQSLPSECALQLDLEDARLVLAALGYAVSYLLEEPRPEDRGASVASAARFSALRAQLLHDVARVEIHESCDDLTLCAEDAVA